MSLIHVEQLEKDRWRVLPLDDVQHTKLGIIVGGRFRILVEGKIVYDNKKET